MLSVTEFYLSLEINHEIGRSGTRSIFPLPMTDLMNTCED